MKSNNKSETLKISDIFGRLTVDTPRISPKKLKMEELDARQNEYYRSRFLKFSKGKVLQHWHQNQHFDLDGLTNMKQTDYAVLGQKPLLLGKDVSAN
jgi:hypothetical protein